MSFCSFRKEFIGVNSHNFRMVKTQTFLDLPNETPWLRKTYVDLNQKTENLLMKEKRKSW